MKLAKIFTAVALSALMFSSHSFAETTSGSLHVGQNLRTGDIMINNITTWKSNGTPEGDALAKKCNELEKKRVDKYVEKEKYFLEHKNTYEKSKKYAQLVQEKKDMTKNMVKEGCFKE
ncbi:MAG: hypothetical protein ACI4NE_02665 [Succinivibrio sp.]